MASQFGVRAGTGRCHQFWKAFEECMDTTTTGTECRLIREDYIECLHHKKEFARAAQVEAARELKASGGGDDHGHGH
ncbi:uncharacterized protein AMSG_08185 [Thecamonas trahens ATCC 50062]|uniref:NADH dehydrogenase [ubiquinone] iron-sulfur protein 5 n=1 Tax=Thecamonas trahens ATCC 50062 TaxID=461836 RepID=A0A0L0DI10_THETB|nr:hypothetical protein AMSG_08185 [Thecamonas trahens ATCC 50062]KNC51942.1 hypothetical protein AMSG_08185 [Thecamonas trahens ATCC 50062]|eukprot:XP_013755535.1 hypothetical protein AMSG_08185 [Thecamonas trahens ATCC 50062]